MRGFREGLTCMALEYNAAQCNIIQYNIIQRGNKMLTRILLKLSIQNFCYMACKVPNSDVKLE